MARAIKGLSSASAIPTRGLGSGTPAPASGLRSSQINQALYGIRYNPSTQQRLNTSPEQFQSLRNDTSNSFRERFQSTRQWGRSMHDRVMENIQRKKDLESVSKLQNQLNTVAMGQGGMGSGPATAQQLQQSVGVNKSSLGGSGTTAFRSEIIARAKRYLGTPYSLGGGHQPNATTPSRGFNGLYGLDCSGLTGIVYRQMGINLPAVANQQSVYGKRTSIANARPGDLVGWARGGHIAIYIGGGKIIHAPRPGEVVQIRSLFPGEKVFAVQLTLPGD